MYELWLGELLQTTVCTEDAGEAWLADAEDLHDWQHQTFNQYFGWSVKKRIEFLSTMYKH